MLHQLLFRYVTRTCIQRNKKAHQGGQECTSRHASAKAFGMVGNPLPTSCSNGVPIQDISDTVGHKSTHVTETVYRHVIVPQIRGGATVMDAVFGDSDNEADQDGGDYSKEAKTALGSWLGSFQ
jgi:hypothetical protein